MNRASILTGSLAAALLLPSAAAASDASAVVHLAEALRIQTISHQDASRFDAAAFRAFDAFLQETYPRAFSELAVEKVSDYSLLIRWGGSDESLPPVLFEGHYDVVPIEPGTLVDWTHAPFSGAVVDGVVWGRGAVDDKLAVVAMFEAIEELLRRGFEPQRSLWFAIGHDEEIGGRQGAAKIAAQLAERGVHFEYMVGEGGGVIESYPVLPDRPMAMIGLAEKTYVTMHLSAVGEGGHSSAPPRDNAIVRLGYALAALHENPFDTKLVSPVSDMFEALAPHVGGLTGFAFEQQWIAAPLLRSQLAGDRIGQTMVRTTTGVTMFDAGVKENVVPQRATAAVNFRVLPGDDPDELVEQVRALIDDPEIEIRAEVWGPIAPVADKNAEGYRRIRAALEKVIPEVVVVPGLVTATTDTRHYAELADNVYRARPYTIDLAEPVGVHDTNESIQVRSVTEGIDFYLELMQSVARP